MIFCHYIGMSNTYFIKKWHRNFITGCLLYTSVRVNTDYLAVNLRCCFCCRCVDSTAACEYNFYTLASVPGCLLYTSFISVLYLIV